MDTTQGFTRRPGFEELPLPEEPDVLAALQPPSVEGFLKAAELLHASCQQRLDSIESIAREQSDAVGEADLRRLRRQFSSLKNTFLHYEVKQLFIAGLSEGLPSGSEADELQQVEQEVATNVELLRGLKQQNEQVQHAIAGLVDRILDVRESAERHRRGMATDLARLQEDLAHHADLMRQPLPELPEEGLDEEELRAALSAAAAATREDEYNIAAELAMAQELEAAVACEQAELETLKAQLLELEVQTEVQGQRVETDTRLRQGMDRCDAIMALLSTLSGISVLSVSDNLVQLQLSTACPAGHQDASYSAQHTLALQLHPHTREVEQALLTPPDVEVADVVEAAQAESLGMGFVVRELQARLSNRRQQQQQQTPSSS